MCTRTRARSGFENRFQLKLECKYIYIERFENDLNFFTFCFSLVFNVFSGYRWRMDDQADDQAPGG